MKQRAFANNCNQPQTHRVMQTMLKNQTLTIKMFQSKWQMAGQKAHVFVTRTRSETENFVREEMVTVQSFEDSFQRQYDGKLRSHVHAIQDECQDRVGQEEDKLRKGLQKALTQKSSMYRDQLPHQT